MSKMSPFSSRHASQFNDLFTVYGIPLIWMVFLKIAQARVANLGSFVFRLFSLS